MDETQVRAIVRDELKRLALIQPEFLGDRIRASRLAAGKSQRDLAEEYGCSQATIQAIETGTRPILLRRLDDLAALLGKRIILVDVPEEAPDGRD